MFLLKVMSLDSICLDNTKAFILNVTLYYYGLQFYLTTTRWRTLSLYIMWKLSTA